jgi:hypothetical protein
VNIRASDDFLVRFSRRAHSLLRRLGDWETHFLGSQLAAIPLERPVFITGLARSGTTVLLELLAAIDGVATHRYRDFPFLTIPYLWNRYLDGFPVREQPVERPHQDRIYITRESPEAMEEPLWRAFFPRVHAGDSLHRMTAADANPDFERFYAAHLRKVLLVRGGRRYAAKNNYHVPRIEYLANLFPDARFIVPTRHPLTHIDSLVRQHQKFSSYAAADPRVPRWLEAAGHFEFGPQRLPIRLREGEGERTTAAWSRGEEHLGYAIQWKEVYGFVAMLRRTNPELAQRILVLRYEDLCDAPETTFHSLLQTLGVDQQSARRALPQLEKVSLSQHAPALDQAAQTAIRAEVEAVAESYGYSISRL